MTWLLIFGGVFLAILLAMHFTPEQKQDDATNWAAATVVATLAGFVVVGVCALVYFIAVNSGSGVWKDAVRVSKLASVKDGMAVEGSLSGTFLTTYGSITSGLMLNFYVAHEGGYFTPDSLKIGDMSNVRIYEVQDGNYRLEEHYNSCQDEMCTDSSRSEGPATRWDFYVPPGSVVTDFKLNAS